MIITHKFWVPTATVDRMSLHNINLYAYKSTHNISSITLFEYQNMAGIMSREMHLNILEVN